MTRLEIWRGQTRGTKAVIIAGAAICVALVAVVAIKGELRHMIPTALVAAGALWALYRRSQWTHVYAREFLTFSNTGVRFLGTPEVLHRMDAEHMVDLSMACANALAFCQEAYPALAEAMSVRLKSLTIQITHKSSPLIGNGRESIGGIVLPWRAGEPFQMVPPRVRHETFHTLMGVVRPPTLDKQDKDHAEMQARGFSA